VLKHNLRKKYNISPEQRNSLIVIQGGKCAVSGRRVEFKKHSLAVPAGTSAVIDHDHGTGKIRGILSNNINRGLGLFDHNPEWLRKAADYLESHKAN